MKEKIKEYMNNLVLEGVFPGACYACYYKGKLVMDAVGYKSLFPIKEKNNLNTLYDIASLTKLVVTNTLMAMAEEEGILSFEDSFQKYFPKFSYKEVTLFHLLTHSSGLKATYDKYHLVNKEEFFTKIEATSKPEEEIVYSDLNYILLGFLLEKVYNKSLKELANERIFLPLGMMHTSYTPKNLKQVAPTEMTSQRGLLRGLPQDEKAYFLKGVAGHAGVFSTVEDMYLFGKMVLENDGSFLPKKRIDTWFQPLVTSKKKLSRSHSWIIANTAFDTKAVASKQAIYHTGFSGCDFLIDKEKKWIFILLSNRVHPSRENPLLADRRKEIHKEIYKMINEG